MPMPRPDVPAELPPVELPADFDPDAPKYRQIGAELDAHLTRCEERIARDAALAARRTG